MPTANSVGLTVLNQGVQSVTVSRLQPGSGERKHAGGKPMYQGPGQRALVLLLPFLVQDLSHKAHPTVKSLRLFSVSAAVRKY